MSAPLMIFIASAVLLTLFAILFRVEESRGGRLLLSGARDWLDRRVLSLDYFFSHVSINWGSGAVRITFHFLMHKVLSTVREALKSLEYKVTHLQRQNRNIVKSFNTGKERTHLHLIAEHQANTALSDAEKRQLKNKAIEPN